MEPNHIAAIVFFGPIAILWLTAMLKGCYNIVKHNNVFGDKK